MKLGRRFFGMIAVVVAVAACAAAQDQPAAQGPNAAKIIDAWMRAEGGSKRLSQLRTVEYQGTVTDAATKASGPYTLILEQPNRIYEEADLAGGKMRVAYNGKSAWREDAKGLRTLTGSEADLLESTARYRNGRFTQYKKNKVRIRSLGEQTIRGHLTHRVEVTTSAGTKRDVYFDAASDLIVEEAVAGSSADGASGEQNFYSDYRPVDGIHEPYRIEYDGPGRAWAIAIAHVLHNPAVSDTIFAFPSASDRPLPDIADLLKAVDKNQKAIEKLLEQYTCDKTQTEFEVDSHGAVKQKGTKEYEVFYLGGDEVDRLIAKDGKPLSPDEDHRESERVQKRARDYENKQVKIARQPDDAGQKRRDKDDVQISDFLRIDRFTNPRRETFRGHEVIVFDFEPNPSYKPSTTVERLLHEFEGSVWIDEQARDVVRLEGYLNGSFKLAGGLFASVQKGSAFTFEQAKINDEVWMPSYLEAHVNAKLLLVKGLSGNFTERYSNYQKFHVESVTQAGTVRGN
ncbi:MAG TPA: hypothetical protein VMT20_16820 [Terriglobia bacterium]|nr:hypothetical protein [Terriglobia bacterium]